MPKHVGCSQSVTVQNRGSSACDKKKNKSQTCETGACPKEVCIHKLQPGRTVGSQLRDHFIFLLKPMFSQEQGGQGFFSQPIIFLVFGTWEPYPFIFLRLQDTQVLSTHISNFCCAGALSTCLSSFPTTQCKNLFCLHLGQWGRLPQALADCGN